MLFQEAVRCYFRWCCDDKIAMILPFPPDSYKVASEDLHALFDPWADEIKLYDMNKTYSDQVRKFETSNFTQLVWSETRRIGCGRMFMADIEKLIQGHFFVCNYGPTGNIYGKDIYMKGPPCSNCPPLLKYSCSLHYDQTLCSK